MGGSRPQSSLDARLDDLAGFLDNATLNMHAASALRNTIEAFKTPRNDNTDVKLFDNSEGCKVSMLKAALDHFKPSPPTDRTQTAARSPCTQRVRPNSATLRPGTSRGREGGNLGGSLLSTKVHLGDRFW